MPTTPLLLSPQAAPSEPTSRRLFLCGPGSGASPAGVAIVAEDKAEAMTERAARAAAAAVQQFAVQQLLEISGTSDEAAVDENVQPWAANCGTPPSAERAATTQNARPAPASSRIMTPKAAPRSQHKSGKPAPLSRGGARGLTPRGLTPRAVEHGKGRGEATPPATPRSLLASYSARES